MIRAYEFADIQTIEVLVVADQGQSYNQVVNAASNRPPLFAAR
jgi:hypothetical protein